MQPKLSIFVNRQPTLGHRMASCPDGRFGKCHFFHAMITTNMLGMHNVLKQITTLSDDQVLVLLNMQIVWLIRDHKPDALANMGHGVAEELLFKCTHDASFYSKAGSPPYREVEARQG